MCGLGGLCFLGGGWHTVWGFRQAAAGAVSPSCKHGLSSQIVARITSDCGLARCGPNRMAVLVRRGSASSLLSGPGVRDARDQRDDQPYVIYLHAVSLVLPTSHGPDRCASHSLKHLKA